MGKSRVEPLKSSKKKEREIEAQIDAINQCYMANQRKLDSLSPHNPEDRAKAHSFFKGITESLREEIKSYIELGYTEEEALTRVLPKAFGAVKAASGFLWKKPHYNVQLKGAILLNEGYASQMATGEGKTLMATLPAYLNALLGKGVHVITPNPYLAMRDQKETSELYELMGLTCGLVEERENLSVNDIAKQILQPAIDEYIANARIIANAELTDEQIQQVTDQFFKDQRNQEIIDKALKQAKSEYEIRNAEETIKRQEAYSADITYGSSSAIAFDYLFDGIAKDPSSIVQRIGRPNFAIVDEVDEVLFDDAVTPFTLSGSQDDAQLKLPDQEKKESERDIQNANYAVSSILKKEESLRKIDPSDKLIFVCTRDNNFDNFVNSKETEQIHRIDMNYAVVTDKKTKRYHLTTLGQTILFQYYRSPEIRDILLTNQEKIINLKNNGRPVFQAGKDYTFDENGYIVMDPRAFCYLTTSGIIPELNDAFENFGIHELSQKHFAIDNAMKAWFSLEEDVDYVLAKPSDAKKDNERTISLVINGRTAEGRVYSEGLQQAVEAKEKTKKIGRFTIRPTKIKSTLASIPTAAFFARYSRMGGMTGTSAITAFRELYGLETVDVPRQKDRKVNDRGDQFYTTTEAKNAAIFEEVFASYLKGQPVLLSTTSIEESEKLYNYLIARFKEKGYSIDIPVLNARQDDLAKEAKIIARAGLPKAITISTEMAGRGTDIKLGGEVPSISDLMKAVTEEIVKKTVDKMRQNGTFDEKNSSFVINEIRKMVLSQKDALEIEKKARARQEKLQAYKTVMAEQVKTAGGLKVIGSGHFSYSRVDDQVKGRCGRQGDPGETIFFTDPSDLLKIGITQKEVSELIEEASTSRDGAIKEDVKKGYTPISDMVYHCQANTEFMVKESIRVRQEVEVEVSKYRDDLRVQKDELRVRDEYEDAVEYMIEETATSIIKSSTARENAHINDNTRVSSAHLDLVEIASKATEFLGVEISPEDLEQFRKVGQIREFLQERGLQHFRETIQSQNPREVNAQCKKIVETSMSRAWDHFEEYVENIRQQQFLNGLMQIEQRQSGTAAQILRSYRHCIETERAKSVRSILNPNYESKYGKSAREELETVRVTDKGVRRVEKDYDAQTAVLISETEHDALEEQDNLPKIRNLQPRPRIFTLLERVFVKKNPSKGQVQPETDLSSDVETVEFSGRKK